MTTTARGTSTGFVTLPRAVLSAAATMVYTVERAVIGDARVRTARGNAWEAVCADRARALQRDEVRRLVATMARTGEPRRDPLS